MMLAGDVLGRLPGFDTRGTHGAALCRLAARVGAMLHEMLNERCPMDVLAALGPSTPLYLEPRQLPEAVSQEVDAAEAIDVHTHLFAAPSPALQFGIDALLTYHYVVAQYLAVADVTADAFLSLPVPRQAEAVWRGLFVERSPLSEPCRGILSTLHALGMHEEVAARDLPAIRRWYATQDGERLNEKVPSAA